MKSSRSREAMGSRELGLVLAQQLLDVEDLHYGLWEPDLPLSLGNLAEAQRRYSERLFTCLPPVAGSVPPRVLDVGCGTGHTLQQLLQRGYRVDGVSPAPALTRLVQQRLDAIGEQDTQVMSCRFEDLPGGWGEHAFDVVLFSESFQYIPLPRLFERLPRLLKPGGRVVIADFFKTAAHGDGEAGDRSFGGGHEEAAFNAAVASSPFEIVTDEDITSLTSPNIELLDEWLRGRVGPALGTLDEYLGGRRPWLYGLFKWLNRKRLERARYKYLEGNRTREVFEKYKRYRLLLLQAP